MAVRIRMKQLGRTHRRFYRICAMDQKSPRDGRVMEELGTYDPMVSDVDARAILKSERIDYWLGVGAQPSEKVAVLIKKYGSSGTHATKQSAALERLGQPRELPDPGPPASLPKSQEEPAAEAPAEAAATEAPAEAAVATEEAPAAEAPAETAAEEAPAEASEPAAEEAAAAEEEKSE